VYRGDIWVAPSTGGRAVPITRHVAYDAYPLWSPDGKWLAFGSVRNGNWDIFAIPVEGGAPVQLTFHAQAEIPSSWSRDGRFLYYSASYDSNNPALIELEVATGRFRRVVEDYVSLSGPQIAPDGKTLAYGRNGFPWWRPRYTGSGAMQVWLYDMQSGERRALTRDQNQHLWTQWLPDGRTLLTVTIGEKTPDSPRLGERLPVFQDNARRTPNLWTIDLNGRKRQLTQFVGGAVRFPTVAANTGDIAFEYEGHLYLLKSGQRQPQKLRFVAAQDDAQTTRQRELLTSGVEEAEPSPTASSTPSASAATSGSSTSKSRKPPPTSATPSSPANSPTGSATTRTSCGQRMAGRSTSLPTATITSSSTRLMWPRCRCGGCLTAPPMCRA
jgi:tricorn protease